MSISQSKVFSEEKALQYIRSVPGLFGKDAELACQEIGDGNLNLVFRIQERQSGKNVIIKQALPYARIVGESMPLTADRSRIEAEAMREEARFCPDYVPEIYHMDHENHLFVMQDLSDHKIMRRGLIERNKYPLFAQHIGEFMAKTFFYTSDFHLQPFAKKEMVKKFINPELCKISEDLIFTQPYYDAAENNISPEIRGEAEKIWADEPLKAEVAELKYHFMTRADALLHGDLHTGSIFITPESTKVIDAEFAFYGPMGFDIGAVIANLMLNYAAQEGWSRTEEEKADMRQYLLNTINETWAHFTDNFSRLMKEECHDPMFSSPSFQEEYLRRVFADTLGYAGCKMIRRIYGLAHVADIDTIKETEKRVTAQRTALQIGRALIINRKQLGNMGEIVQLVNENTIQGGQV